ncbi:hypothetical protein MKW98_008504 [Papaver atlanticum]|uniref:Wall-associated receptor kinase galacturonan-binding domain-containing protein n=1 Tax=Papaver atlanticum TaxID=357466 RepID=A0AAD4T9T8_9MAGN|nr:hypothetical protein MKW98_008504 [Papaver atlanticum]
MLATSLDAFGETKPGCPDKCGNVIIPYPFGITSEGGGEGCSISEVGYGYSVNCDSSFDPPKPFIGTTSLQILGISETEIRIANSIAKLCFNKLGRAVINVSTVYTSVRRTPFTFSSTKNRQQLYGITFLMSRTSRPTVLAVMLSWVTMSCSISLHQIFLPYLKTKLFPLFLIGQ